MALYVAIVVAAFIEFAAGKPPLLDLRAPSIVYFSPFGALGLAMAISAWRRGTSYRRPTRLPGRRRSIVAVGVLVMLVAAFDLLSWPLGYESHFQLGLFALPAFCGGLLVWWLAVRVGR